MSIPTPIVETPMEKANEAITDPTSHKATSKDTTVVIVHTTTSWSTPINYAHLEVVTKYEVKDMIGQAMDNFAIRQRARN